MRIDFIGVCADDEKKLDRERLEGSLKYFDENGLELILSVQKLILSLLGVRHCFDSGDFILVLMIYWNDWTLDGKSIGTIGRLMVSLLEQLDA